MSAVFLAVPAYAAPTKIVCNGGYYETWKDGSRHHVITGAIVIQLDDAAQSVALVSSGSMELNPSNGQPQVTQYDSNGIDFKVHMSNSYGRLVESATINRLTGDFQLVDTFPNGITHIYTGTCTKAEQQF